MISATDRGSARSFDKNHRGKGWDELGYHFVIGNGQGSPDGHIEVGPRGHKQKHGAHCKTLDNHFNEHGIGICLVGDFTESRPTRRQLASLTKLAAFLCSECGISPDRITTHGAVTGKTYILYESDGLAGLRTSPVQTNATPAGGVAPWYVVTNQWIYPYSSTNRETYYIIRAKP